MFSLKSFLQTIQDAVLNANEALMDRNLEVFNKYFESDDDDMEIQKRIDEALAASKEILNPKTKINRQSVDDLKRTAQNLQQSLDAPDALDQALASADIRPKTVILNYPTTSTDGTVLNKEVHVPLITLVPVQFSKVEEVRLNADMELSLVDDEVQVSLGKFSGQQRVQPSEEGSETPPPKKNTVGNIEIVLKPQEVSDGMQQIIDAYEKILKAQLPQ